MIYQVTFMLQRILSNCFALANSIFSKVGIGLTAAVCVMVLISSVLRLFTARFIGGQIVQADERIRSNAERAYNNSYEGYRDRADRKRSYQARYESERGIPPKDSYAAYRLRRSRNESYDRRYRAEKRRK